MSRLAPAQSGLLLLIAGAAIDSTSGIFTRLLPSDGFTTASGRGLAAFVILMLVLLLRDGRGAIRSLFAIGFWGFAFVALNGSGMVVNILSLSLTSVANFFMIFATAPFVAALGAWALLGERPDRATLLAAFAGLAGIAVMMFAGARSGSLLGDILACVCVLLYCALVLVLRHARRIDILPTITLTVLTSGVLALPFADFSAMTPRDGWVMAAFGCFQLALGNMLIFTAVSRIPAAQGGLLGILIAGFAPLWVLAFLGEVPPPTTLAGGAIILSAAIAHLVWTLRQSKRGLQPVP
jgi:drug/metabolite transporter (DMT)-like permease